MAPLGLAVAAILMAVLAAAAWRSLEVERRAAAAARRVQVTAVAAVTADASARLLRDGLLSDVRVLLAGVAQENKLDVCRLSIPGGAVLADGRPSAITAVELPGAWGAADGGAPAGGVEGTGLAGADGAIRSVVRFEVPGRGPATLELSGAPEARSEWGERGVVGAIAASGMTALLAVYRSVRRRVRGVSMVREALMAWSRDAEEPTEALRVSEAFGEEGRAWNRLLRERDRLRAQAESRAPAGAGGAHARGDDACAVVCDALWMGLALVDSAMRVRYVNGAASALLGGKRESVAGGDVGAHVADGAALELVRSAAQGAVRARRAVEVPVRTPSGESVIRWSARTAPWREGNAAVLVLEDVTQQRVADEARNAFVAQATHELRTPLTNIRLYVEALVEQQEDDPVARARCINVINQEVRRLERIVGDMLSMSEIEAGSFQLVPGDVRLGQLFEEIEADYRAQAADKEIALRFQLPPKLPVVRADRDKLALALHNLIGNGLKYTPQGGEVSVTVAATPDLLTVDVADNGIGIREEEQERIFDRFYRAKDGRLGSIAGSGLGLTLAREVMRLHGGDVTVRSQINKGSTFTLTLPVRARSAPVVPAAA